VEHFVLVTCLLLACEGFFNECDYTAACVLGKVSLQRAVSGLVTGSRKLTISCSSPLYQHGPFTEEHASVSESFAPLIGLWSKQRRGESSPTVRSERRRLSCAAQLCSAFPFPVLRKEGLSKQELLSLACSSSLGPGGVTWLWLRGRLR